LGNGDLVGQRSFVPLPESGIWSSRLFVLFGLLVSYTCRKFPPSGSKRPRPKPFREMRRAVKKSLPLGVWISVGALGLLTSTVRSPLPESQAMPLPTNSPRSEEAIETMACPRTTAAPSLLISMTESVSLPLTNAYSMVPSRAKPVTDPETGSV